MARVRFLSGYSKTVELPKDSAYDVMKVFKDAMNEIAAKFAEEFPVGTFVKTWYKGQEYDTTFCYVSSEPVILLDDAMFSSANIDSFKEYQKDPNDASPVFWYYVPIDIKCNPESTWYRRSHSFGICQNRFVEKSSIEEYKQYMLDKYKKNIEENKKEIRQRKEWIKNYKKSVREIDKDVSRAVQYLEDNFKKETEKRDESEVL